MLAAFSSALLIIFVGSLTYFALPADPAAAASTTKTETWAKNRTATLSTAQGKRQRQITTLHRQVSRSSKAARKVRSLRKMMLKRGYSIIKLNKELAKLNAVVLKADYDASDPVVVDLLKLNVKIRKLDSRAAAYTRRAKVPGRKSICRSIVRWRNTLAAQTKRLKGTTGSKPAPAPTPQPTTTPTPEPAPTQEPGRNYSAPSAPPVTTSTITDLKLSSGQSDIVYENVRFVSSQSVQKATVTITRATNITFRDCVIEGSDWNAITINDTAGSVSGISFIDTYVESSPRMGFECTSRGSSTRAYNNINLLGVTFEPQGSEAISFDSSAVVDVESTVSGVVIRGAGTRPDLYPWGQGFEINGPKGFLVEDLTIYRTRGSNFNLSGRGVATDWTFRDITVDNTRNYLGSVQRSSNANVLYADRVVSSVWTDTTFTNCLPSGCGGYIDESHDNDFSGITWRGSPRNVLQDTSTGNLL